MRLPIPPAWRDLARGGPDSWQLLALLAAIAGGAWLLSPYATMERIAGKRRELVGRQPNATGRALGLTAGQLDNPYQDPIEVLAMRAAVARAGTNAPVYRGSRAELFGEYLAAPPEVTWPIVAPQTVQLNRIAAQAPFRGVPIQAGPGVAITAQEVLAMQLARRRGQPNA